MIRCLWHHSGSSQWLEYEPRTQPEVTGALGQGPKLPLFTINIISPRLTRGRLVEASVLATTTKKTHASSPRPNPSQDQGKTVIIRASDLHNGVDDEIRRCLLLRSLWCAVTFLCHSTLLIFLWDTRSSRWRSGAQVMDGATSIVYLVHIYKNKETKRHYYDPYILYPANFVL